MFTGLVESFGTLMERDENGAVLRLTIAAPMYTTRLREGDSVAVNGVCLTALEIGKGDPAVFSADLAAETMARTTLARLPLGTRLNLELPTPAGTPLGGHVVQGHVDGVGTLESLTPVSGMQNGQPTDWQLVVRLPRPLLRYVVEKGSISIDGISLTVAAVEDNCIRIAILPHTYWVTNLHTLKPGADVNIEVDALARYAEQLAATLAQNPPAETLTLAGLIARGY